NATYTFNPNGGESTDKSNFMWGNKGDTAGMSSGTDISTSGTIPGVVLVAADVGQVKEVSIQAENGLNVLGNTLTVDSSMTAGEGNETGGGKQPEGEVIDPNADPLVADLKMSGTLEVGQSLSATYTFNPNGGETTDKSNFQWGNKGQTAGMSSGADISTSGTIPGLPLRSEDIGQIKEVSIQAENGLNITGNTLTVDSSMSSGAGNETAGGVAGGEVDPVANILPSNLVIVKNNSLAGSVSGNKVEAVVIDALGNVLPNYPVVFTADNGAVITAEPIITDVAGKVTTDFTNLVAGKVTITATAGTHTQTNTDANFTASFTGITAKGSNFSIESGFPKTAYKNAAFNFMINGTSANNALYTWSSNNPNVGVTNGIVTFLADTAPGSADTDIVVTLNGGETLVYQISLNHWFKHSADTSRTSANNATWCEGMGYEVPEASLLTDAPTPVGQSGARAANGKLWNEWGGLYSGHKDYWSATANGAQFVTVDLTNNATGGETMSVASSFSRYGVCVLTL
ncbi:Ig-like domain-containing protein, partial [Plesiomonas sp.]|uniref:Ig-like domain-containing protein n=1 Tax=Plesiomonas sp. TaxID=2486279 RepID=UPI003F2EA42B